ncbi:MAG TPA: flavodoxin [Methanocella sp.]|nr:flavodoxin [Methanocella sp.]
MKIGIIVYSQTGHTLEVAEKLAGKLRAAGHTASIEQIVPFDAEKTPQQRLPDIRFEKRPDPGPYDALAFGAPVQGFSLAKAMKAYMGPLPSLQGKKVALFTTKHLRFKWTGGTQAISAMRKSCESKGGKVCETGIVTWSGADRDRQIADLVDRLSRCF